MSSRGRKIQRLRSRPLYMSGKQATETVATATKARRKANAEKKASA